MAHHVGKLCGDISMGERFKNGKWTRLIATPNRESYDTTFVLMRDAWVRYPRVVDYVETTWLVHREEGFEIEITNYRHVNQLSDIILPFVKVGKT